MKKLLFIVVLLVSVLTYSQHVHNVNVKQIKTETRVTDSAIHGAQPKIVVPPVDTIKNKDTLHSDVHTLKPKSTNSVKVNSEETQVYNVSAAIGIFILMVIVITIVFGNWENKKQIEPEEVPQTIENTDPVKAKKPKSNNNQVA